MNHRIKNDGKVDRLAQSILHDSSKHKIHQIIQSGYLLWSKCDIRILILNWVINLRDLQYVQCGIFLIIQQTSWKNGSSVTSFYSISKCAKKSFSDSLETTLLYWRKLNILWRLNSWSITLIKKHMNYLIFCVSMNGITQLPLDYLQRKIRS